jgi:hypothetical protein
MILLYSICSINNKNTNDTNINTITPTEKKVHVLMFLTIT